VLSQVVQGGGGVELRHRIRRMGAGDAGQQLRRFGQAAQMQ
jgi:hypothetical protein